MIEATIEGEASDRPLGRERCLQHRPWGGGILTRQIAPLERRVRCLPALLPPPPGRGPCGAGAARAPRLPTSHTRARSGPMLSALRAPAHAPDTINGPPLCAGLRVALAWRRPLRGTGPRLGLRRFASSLGRGEARRRAQEGVGRLERSNVQTLQRANGRSWRPRTPRRPQPLPRGRCLLRAGSRGRRAGSPRCAAQPIDGALAAGVDRIDNRHLTLERRAVAAYICEQSLHRSGRMRPSIASRYKQRVRAQQAVDIVSTRTEALLREVQRLVEVLGD